MDGTGSVDLVVARRRANSVSWVDLALPEPFVVVAAAPRPTAAECRTSLRCASLLDALNAAGSATRGPGAVVIVVEHGAATDVPTHTPSAWVRNSRPLVITGLRDAPAVLQCAAVAWPFSVPFHFRGPSTASVTFRHLVVRGCDVAGLATTSGPPLTVENVVFEQPLAAAASAAMVTATGSGAVVLRDVTAVLPTSTQLVAAASAASLLLDNVHVTTVPAAPAAAPFSAGAVFADTTPLTIVRSSFTGCVSAASGGALHVTGGGALSVTSTDFVDTTAGANGGAVSVGSQSECTLTNVRVVNASAFAGCGGAAFFDSSSTLVLSDVTVTGCSAANGGGVCSSGFLALTMATVALSDNTATTRGGSLFLSASSFTQVFEMQGVTVTVTAAAAATSTSRRALQTASAVPAVFVSLAASDPAAGLLASGWDVSVPGAGGVLLDVSPSFDLSSVSGLATAAADGAMATPLKYVQCWNASAAGPCHGGAVPVVDLQAARTVFRLLSHTNATVDAVLLNGVTCQVQVPAAGVQGSTGVLTAATSTVAFPVLSVLGRRGATYAASVTCAQADAASPVVVGVSVEVPPCSAGQQATVDLLSCELCEAGTHNPRPNASSAACVPCEPGAVSGAGAQACGQCDAGTFTSDGRTCVDCGPGTFSAAAGGSSCQACAAGFVAPGDRATQCTPCAAGTSTSDAQTCTPCPAGTYNPTSPGMCEACAAGYISAGNAQQCSPCPRGSFAASTSRCEQCPDGFTTLSSGAVSAASCVCPAGTYRDGTADECTPCAALDGLQCPASRRGITVASLPIDAGHWRATPNSTLVRPCRVDDVCVGRAAQPVCQDGSDAVVTVVDVLTATPLLQLQDVWVDKVTNVSAAPGAVSAAPGAVTLTGVALLSLTVVGGVPGVGAEGGYVTANVSDAVIVQVQYHTCTQRCTVPGTAPPLRTTCNPVALFDGVSMEPEVGVGRYFSDAGEFSHAAPLPDGALVLPCAAYSVTTDCTVGRCGVAALPDGAYAVVKCGLYDLVHACAAVGGVAVPSGSQCVYDYSPAVGPPELLVFVSPIGPAAPPPSPTLQVQAVLPTAAVTVPCVVAGRRTVCGVKDGGTVLVVRSDDAVTELGSFDASLCAEGHRGPLCEVSRLLFGVLAGAVGWCVCVCHGVCPAACVHV